MKSLALFASLALLVVSAAAQTVVHTGDREKQYLEEPMTVLVMQFGGPWSVANAPFDNYFICTGPYGSYYDLLPWSLAWSSLSNPATEHWEESNSGSGTASTGQKIVAYNNYYTITDSYPLEANATQYIVDEYYSLQDRTAVEKITNFIEFRIEN